jgi:hypothetical protein
MRGCSIRCDATAFGRTLSTPWTPTNLRCSLGLSSAQPCSVCCACTLVSVQAPREERPKCSATLGKAESCVFVYVCVCVCVCACVCVYVCVCDSFLTAWLLGSFQRHRCSRETSDMSFYMSSYMSFYMLPYMSFYMSSDMSFYMSSYMSFYMSSYMSFYMSSYMSFYMSSYMSFYLLSYMSVSSFPSVYYSLHPNYKVCMAHAHTTQSHTHSCKHRHAQTHTHMCNTLFIFAARCCWNTRARRWVCLR